MLIYSLGVFIFQKFDRWFIKILENRWSLYFKDYWISFLTNHSCAMSIIVIKKYIFPKKLTSCINFKGLCNIHFLTFLIDGYNFLSMKYSVLNDIKVLQRFIEFILLFIYHFIVFIFTKYKFLLNFCELYDWYSIKNFKHFLNIIHIFYIDFFIILIKKGR